MQEEQAVRQENSDESKIAKEVRDEFQIPPYFPDTSLLNFVREGQYRLKTFVSNADFIEDLTARFLLKTYVNYAYFKKVNEFMEEYNNDILAWQFSKLDASSNIQ